MTQYWVSRTCEGERCNYRQPGAGMACGADAEHKVVENIAFDDPFPRRHSLTAYLCPVHYDAVMGPMAENVRQMQLASLDPPST